MLRALLIAAILLLPGLSALAGDRVALLIGNATYQRDEFTLKNPVNDVTALGERLSALGFKVTVVANAGQADMRKALAGFESAAQGADTALFFYAGHGMQVERENLLLASDLSGTTVTDLKSSTIALGEVRAALTRAKPGIGILVLDACRDNPLALAGGVVDGKGLKRDDGAAGLLIAYSTDPGDVAYDGAGANSVFAEALLRHMGTPGLDVRLMFGRVRQQVVLATAGKQVPWVEESVIGEHRLNLAPAPGDALAATDREVTRWREVSARLDAEPYRDYLRDYPDGLFRAFAEERLARLANPAGGKGAVLARSDIDSFVATADPGVLTSALSTLGFLPQTRGVVPPDALRTAVEAWAAREQGGNPDPKSLYTDAARVTVFLGARLATRIRTDLVALASVDRAETVAQDAFREIEAMAKSDKAAEALMPQMRGELDAIDAAQARILARLDQSRGFYEELVETGGSNFGDLMTPGLMGLTEDSRSAPGIDADTGRDIRLFLKHARIGQNEQTRGTLTWLSDFLPGS